MTRSSGILLHVTSLPSRFGIGDLGPAAYRWVDALVAAKQRWWQMLPLNPPDDSNSPYSARSALAGNPYLISPDLLVREELLAGRDIAAPAFSKGRVDFERVKPFKDQLLAVAWKRFRARGHTAVRKAFDRFCGEHAGWLDDFALFMALQEKHPGIHWINWATSLVKRNGAAVRQAREELADAIDRHRFIQFLFQRQLDALRDYAKRKNVGLIGDIPIYVSGESADVWANPHLFQLDANRRATAVAGVPPDFFTKSGQRWGNPLFNWPAMRRDGYAWWIARMRRVLSQCDLVRIDHFRGLAGYWHIPASEPTAEHGRWVKGPGAELLGAMQKALGGLPVIAEDLGEITPDVIALRDQFQLPGMQVLQFAFAEENDPMQPHNHPRNAVVYTGTHDNDTTVGWFHSIKPAERARLRRYAPESAHDAAGTLLRMAWASVANLAIVPLQDVLGLGAAARMNMPGIGEGNWGWRMSENAMSRQVIARLAEMTQTYGRWQLILPS